MVQIRWYFVQSRYLSCIMLVVHKAYRTVISIHAIPSPVPDTGTGLSLRIAIEISVAS